MDSMDLSKIKGKRYVLISPEPVDILKGYEKGFTFDVHDVEVRGRRIAIYVNNIDFLWLHQCVEQKTNTAEIPSVDHEENKDPFKRLVDFINSPDDSFDQRRFKNRVSAVLNEVKEMLVSKNKAYGNAALEPLRIFSKVDSTDGILLRIDDKLNRIKNVGITPETEDSVMDLIGYLVLLKISQNNGKPEPSAPQEENNSIPVSNQKGGAIRDYTATGRPENWVTTSTVNGVNIASSSESGKPL